MNIAILGAGHGGCAMAADLALQGHSVSLYDKFPQVLEGLRQRMGLELSYKDVTAFASLHRVSDRIDEVVADAELVMVVTPAFAHEEIANRLVPLLQPGQIIVLNPGRTGGALRVRSIFEQRALETQVFVVEAQTLVYASRRTGPTSATIYERKSRVPLAALPAGDTEVALRTLQPLFPSFRAASSVLETSLLNIGAVFHPGPTLLNMAWIESEQSFKYYHQGFSPGTTAVIERVDAERMAIAQRLGVPTLSAEQWLKKAYNLPSSLQGLLETIRANQAYRDIFAPNTIEVRYIQEDVPTGLVPLAALGDSMGVATPFINMLIDLACCVHRVDYRSQGYSLEKLNLQGGREHILARVGLKPTAEVFP